MDDPVLEDALVTLYEVHENLPFDMKQTARNFFDKTEFHDKDLNVIKALAARGMSNE